MSCCNSNQAQSCSKHVKTVIFVATLCTAIVLFSLPIVLFYVTLYSNNGNSNEASLNNATNISCSSSSTDNLWDIVDYDHITECGTMYSGSVCLPYLTEWQECALEQTANITVLINHASDQDTLNQEISELQDFLITNVSDTHECQSTKVIPFLCHYYFPILDCQSSDSQHNQLYSVSVNYCINITTICSGPLQSAIDVGILNSFSDCSLPMENRNHSNITCREDYVLQNGVCNPRCGEFKVNSPIAIQITFGSEMIAGVIVVIISICIFALTFVNRKSMFRFPSIFLLFFVINAFMAALIILISATSKKTLFCSSINLLESLNNPTIFCTISGAIFHYAYISVIVWWFLHLCTFFYQVMFPFHSDQMRKLGKVNKVSIVLTIIGMLIPLPAVIASLVSEQLGYNVALSPPNYCFPSLYVAFYSIYVPQSILLGVGICLLISIFWRIHLHQAVNAKRSGKIQNLSIAEKKLIFASIWYAVFGSLSYIFFGIASGVFAPQAGTVTEYHECESNGDSFGECDRSTFERPLFAIPNAIANISLGLIPIGVFNFLINWNKMKKKMAKICGKKPSRSERSGSTIRYSLTSRGSSKWTLRGSFDQGSENVTTTTA